MSTPLFPLDVTALDDPYVSSRTGNWLTIGLLTPDRGCREVIQVGVQARVVMRTSEGEALWVGTVLAVSQRRGIFALAPWGMRDALTLRLADVLRAAPVGPHTWAERHAVVVTQRCRLPALAIVH